LSPEEIVSEALDFLSRIRILCKLRKKTECLIVFRKKPSASLFIQKKMLIFF
jgi:hypothetical protein